MTEQINRGDKQALKSLLVEYTKQVYERAYAATTDAEMAKRITRATLNDIIQAAENAACPDESCLHEWIMGLADRHINDETDVRAQVDALLNEVSEEVKPKVDTGWTPPDFAKQWTPPEMDTNWTPPDKQDALRKAQPAAAQEARRADAPAEPKRQSTPARAARTRVPELFDDGRDDDDDDDYDYDEPRHKRSAGMVLLIVALVLVVALLVWMLVVMLMTRGILPMLDFGFAEWFNSNIFKLY